MSHPIDQLFGGIANGSIFEVEDPLGAGAHLFLRQWVQQGTDKGHNVLIFSADRDPTDFTVRTECPVKMQKPAENVRIAWRYTLPSMCPTPVMPTESAFQRLGIKPQRKSTVNVHKLESNETYKECLMRIETEIKIGGPLRIVIDSVGSPFWVGRKNEDLCFVLKLRQLLFGTKASVLLSVAEYISTEKVRLLRTLCNYSVVFQPHKLDNYDGTFRVIKYNAWQRPTAMLGQSLAYEIQHEYLSIVKWHLPALAPEEKGIDF